MRKMAFTMKNMMKKIARVKVRTNKTLWRGNKEMLTYFALKFEEWNLRGFFGKNRKTFLLIS